MLLAIGSSSRLEGGEPRSAAVDSALWGLPPVEYRVLGRSSQPGAWHGHHEVATAPVPPPILSPRPVQPYAYGWFGASSHPHFHRHFVIRSVYTQWKIK